VKAASRAGCAIFKHRIGANPMKILLVESNAFIARVLQQGMQEKGITVTLADDLPQAKRLAQSQSYDLIVLDLPPQIEAAVLQYWRQKRILNPVLFLSAPRDSAVNVDDLGPVAFLTKPFCISDLLSQARRLAGQSDATPPLRNSARNILSRVRKDAG
jgi:DNA-binding response OmpR family regulator